MTPSGRGHARVAIEALRVPTEAICAALEFTPSPPEADLDGTCLSIWRQVWEAAIDAALSDPQAIQVMGEKT